MESEISWIIEKCLITNAAVSSKFGEDICKFHSLLLMKKVFVKEAAVFFSMLAFVLTEVSSYLLYTQGKSYTNML